MGDDTGLQCDPLISPQVLTSNIYTTSLLDQTWRRVAKHDVTDHNTHAFVIYVKS